MQMNLKKDIIIINKKGDFMPEDYKLFSDEFMNDMLLNPKAYGMTGGLKDELSNEDK